MFGYVRKIHRLRAVCGCGKEEVFESTDDNAVPDGWERKFVSYPKQYGWSSDVYVLCPECRSNWKDDKG